MGECEADRQKKGRARAIERYFSVNKRHSARGKWEGLPIAEEKELTPPRSSGNQRSRRSERGDHAREHPAWEHQQDGYCEPSVATRRADSGRARRGSARGGCPRGEARASREVSRRRARFPGG